MGRLNNKKNRTEEVIAKCADNMGLEASTEDVFVVPEKKDCEDEKRSLDDVVALIDAKIEEIEREQSAEGDIILDAVKKTLSDHDIRYTYNQNPQKMVEMNFNIENKTFKVQVILQKEKLIFRLVFPFRVQCNSMVLVTLLAAEFNVDKAFSTMNLDMNDGEITMEYSTLVESEEDFNQENFWIYMTALIHSATELYSVVQRIAVGKVAPDVKGYYKALLEKAIDVISGGEETDDDVALGAEKLKENLEKKADADYFGSKNEKDIQWQDDLDDFSDDGNNTFGMKDSFGEFATGRFTRLLEDGKLFHGEESISKKLNDDELIIPFDMGDILKDSVGVEGGCDHE